MTAHKKCGGAVTIPVIMVLCAAAWSAAAAENTLPSERIAQFNLVSATGEARSAVPESDRGDVPAVGSGGRRPVGSAASTNAGIGRGASVDLTWDDAQYAAGQGRYIGHWFNGLYGEDAAVSVHFGYRDLIDSTTANRVYYSGYNVYDAAATSANWSRGLELGCDLQDLDTLGSGEIPSLDVMPNGRVIMGAAGTFFRSLPDGSRLNDHMVFYQADDFDCTYDPHTSLNVTWVDSTVYRPSFLVPANGAYTRAPQVVSQWDGTNTIVHLLLGENSPGMELTGDDYCNGLLYYSFVYFRKVGETASSGTWSAGQIIDSLWFPWAAMAAAPYPHAGVAVTYTNVTYHGGILDNQYDLDVWLRESPDRGLTWLAAEDITNYENALEGNPNRFTAWLETQPLYTTDGDLNIVWTAQATSVDPYFDGFNWHDYDQNIYHWARSTDDILEVAASPISIEDDLAGSLNTVVCGFGGSNAGYIANVNLAQCDDKLYCLWNQIHERAGWLPWRNAPTQPAPGVLDDCSYNGKRAAKANWEIMMSVMAPSEGGLWDNARNVSNTYTPNCGLDGDPEAQGLCGSEYKPAVEKYGFDESGLSLTWPGATAVDPTPEWDPPYGGTSYLNLQYLDDQYPGPAYWGQTNPPATLNSIKWIRLACVEPIYAPQIAVYPIEIEWPQWVPLGGSENYTITVINDGNVTLNVTEIGVDDNGGGWLSHDVTAYPFQVTAGVARTRTFEVTVDAAGLSGTQWLHGEVWLKSDAPNDDSVSIPLHILAAADVEQVRWDTVTSHHYMFDEFFEPTGACVALAVSNHGEVGYLGTGSVNLDYVESDLECGTRTEDAVYLKSGSPFVITADASDGSGAQLTCSYMGWNQADETGWDPSPEKTMSGGLSSNGEYDSVYTGKFVNRDTTIAMERTFYAPRSENPSTAVINFLICKTTVYSADGAAHDHVTFGNVMDWNVPSDSANQNTTGISLSGGFVYVQGTDTTASSACQTNQARFATEAFAGGYTQTEFNLDPCVNNALGYYGINVLPQSIMADTTHYRNGADLVPDGPDPSEWWDETAVPGLNPDATVQDQSILLTYKQDHNLAASDTLHFWTVLTTVRNGTLAHLQSQVRYARCWYTETIRDCSIYTCCIGKVGDANGTIEDMPTIGDVSVMIDARFITGECIPYGDGANIRCIAEADINVSGGAYPTCEDITIGDISMLIDCLFITGEPPFVRNDCGSGGSGCY